MILSTGQVGWAIGYKAQIPYREGRVAQKLGMGLQAALGISRPSARMGRCNETAGNHWGPSWVQKPFHFPHFLFIRERVSAS